MIYSQVKQAIKESDKYTVRKVLDRHGEDVLIAALECDVNPSDIDEAYQGHFIDDEHFAQEMAESLGEVDKNAIWPQTCIDWESAANELMYDYCEYEGHYFRNL